MKRSRLRKAEFILSVVLVAAVLVVALVLGSPPYNVYFLVSAVFYAIFLFLLFRRTGSRRMPKDSNRFFIHYTSRFIRGSLIVGDREWHDLAVIAHRWSRRVEISVDGEKRYEYAPKWREKAIGPLVMSVGEREPHLIELHGLGTSSIDIRVDDREDYHIEVV